MKYAIVLLAAVLALGFAYWLAQDSGQSAAALSRESEARPPAIEVAGDLPAHAELESPTKADASGPATSERSLVEEPAAAKVETVLQRGQLAITDGNGVPQAGYDGSISINCWTEEGPNRIEVPIQSDQFEFDATGVDYATVHSIDLPGPSPILDAPDEEFPIGSAPMLIRGHLPKTVSLSVVSAKTREHLSQISLVRNGNWATRGQGHPAGTRSLGAATKHPQSPIIITPTDYEANANEVTCFVQSPGYAWKAVHLNMANGGDREVQLEPGASVQINVIGEAPPETAQLRLRQPSASDSTPFASFDLEGSDLVEVEGLPIGTFVATIEIGKWWDEPAELGSVEVQVIADVVGQFDLVLQTPEAVTETQVAGTLLVPEQWKLSSFKLRVELEATAADGRKIDQSLDTREMTSLGPESNSWSFDFGALPVGTYLFEFSGKTYLNPIEYAVEKEVALNASQNLLIEVPPPGTVQIRLVEVGSGKMSEVSSIHWGSIDPTAKWARSLSNVTVDLERELFEFLAPTGSISVGAFGNGYTNLNETLEIGTGLNEFTFELDRDCRLKLQLFDGETRVPLTNHWWPKPTHLDGEGKLLYLGRRDDGLLMGLSQPGRYVFVMPALDGFKAIPDQEISLKRGEETLHRVQLERS